MIPALRYSLLIIGTIIVSWNLSAYQSNISHSTKVKQRFHEFTVTHSNQIAVLDVEFYGAFQKLGTRCQSTDGLYYGDHRIPKAIFGGVMLVGGLLSFFVRQKKKVAEQAAASDA
jgi:hypothetical protein